MHVIELDCPLCASPVRTQKAKPYTRLHCRKCHTPLHLDKAGRAVIGEPPDVLQDLEELKQNLRAIRDRIPVRRIVTTLVAALVFGLPAYFLLGASRGLAQVAEGAARAVAANDAGYIQSIAARGTSDEAKEWLDEAHRQLSRQRERWYAKEEVTEAHVASEDPSQGKGVVMISIRPGFGSARDISLADPAAATAAAASPCTLETVWTQDWLGRWMLDGRDTNAKRGSTP
jgi:hypothetical protein